MIKNEGWEPTKKQAKFLELPHSILEGFYAGAVGAGKSDILLLYPILHRFHENPKFKGLFLRRTFPELKNEIIPRSILFFKKQLGGSYNKNDKIWEFPNKDKSRSPMGAGGLFFFGHCENEEDVHNYDSMQPNYVAFDELTSFTEWIYLYITLQRVRTTVGSGLPAIVRSASNPGNIGHTWVRKRFIDPYPKGGVIIRSESGIKRFYVPATIDDNPHIDPNYRKQLEALPEAEKQAKLYGRWDAYDGQVFEEFRDRNFPDEPEHAIHVIEPFAIPDYWPRIVGMDWGYAPPAMTWVGFGAISPDKRLYIYRELWWQKKKIEEWGSELRPLLDRDNPKVIRLCKSAGQNRGNDHTVQAQIETAIGRQVVLSDNQSGSRVAGKMLLHEYLRWKPKATPVRNEKIFDNTYSDWLLRNRSAEEYRSYITSFAPVEQETNLPKLQIFRDCSKLIEALRSCVYDKLNVQDVAEFDGDDPYDGCRYIVDSADRFFNESANAFAEVQQREALIKNLEETKDWNHFYRNARLMEQRTKSKVFPRYSRH